MSAPRMVKARSVSEASALIEAIGDDVRFKQSRTVFGAKQWTCIVPNGSARAFAATGRTPIEALVAVKAVVDAFESVDLTEALEMSIAVVRSKAGGQ